MSKYEELCTAFDEAHREIVNYSELCGQFLGNLVTGLEVCFNCPPGRIQYQDKVGRKNSLRESMYLEQGNWRLNLALNICRENDTKYINASNPGIYYPSPTVLMSFLVKKVTEQSFIVKVAQYSDDQFTINVNHPGDFKLFYDFVFEIIKIHYKNMLRYVVEHGEVLQEVGLDI